MARSIFLFVVAALLASTAACSDDGADPSGSTDPTASSSHDEPAGTDPREPAVLCPEGEAGPVDRSDPPTSGADRQVIEGTFDDLVPLPAEVSSGDGSFVIDQEVVVVAAPPDAEVAACLLRDELARSTGLRLEVAGGDAEESSPARQIRFEAGPGGGSSAAGPGHPEGYRLEVSPDLVTIEASTAAGYGWAVQTLIQSAPAAVHSPFRAEAALAFPTGTVVDAPRFGWRGLMVDIVRHWFGVSDLERVIDLMAGYKLNVLHLHLSDDQGWRVAIDAYPALTEVGASTQVGGGPGGFLTKDDYRHLVDYAGRRGITVIPEIDLPGHTNAALHAIPELNCDGVAPEPYTGTQVGFSTLCIGDPAVEEFVRTVLAELAEMTPGPYIHIGGDEAHSTTTADYQAFIARTLDVVRDLGKVPVGWEEVGTVPGSGELVAQHWLDASIAEAAVAGGASLVLSPSSVLYFDMAYGEFAPDGNSWAGTTDTREVYDWEPIDQVAVEPSAILGVEAAMWTELIETPDEISLRLLPRLPALAEVAWTAQDRRGWANFSTRLSAHVARWEAAGRPYVDDPGLG